MDAAFEAAPAAAAGAAGAAGAGAGALSTGDVSPPKVNGRRIVPSASTARASASSPKVDTVKGFMNSAAGATATVGFKP